MKKTIVILVLSCLLAGCGENQPQIDKEPCPTLPTDVVSQPPTADEILEHATEIVRNRWEMGNEENFYPDWDEDKLEFHGYHIIEQGKEIGDKIRFYFTDGTHYGEAMVSKSEEPIEDKYQLRLANISLGDTQSLPRLMGTLEGETEEFKVYREYACIAYYRNYKREGNVITWKRDDCIQ